MATAREQRLHQRHYAREQRRQKREEDAAIQADVASRFAAVHALPEPVKNCLRGLVSFKDNLVQTNQALRDARLKDEVTLKESEDELAEVKKDNDMLKSVIQDMTRDRLSLQKQNNLLSSSYEDVLNEHKKLLLAVNTAGECLAKASMAVDIVM